MTKLGVVESQSLKKMLLQTELLLVMLIYLIRDENIPDVHYDPYFYPPIKTFTGEAHIRDHVSLDEPTPLECLKYFLNTFLVNLIIRYFHFSNNEEVSNHSLKKIKPVIDHLKEKFGNTIIAGEKLCIDESLVLWKGKLKFKQFLPLKRHRFGMKIFELADCETGFLLDFIVYTGSDTDYEKFDLGVSGDIVAHFMQPYYNEGRVLYTDNWYTSPQLSDYLHDRNTGLCGTVKKNRKGMPFLSSKLDRGETEVVHTDF